MNFLFKQTTHEYTTRGGSDRASQLSQLARRRFVNFDWLTFLMQSSTS